MTHTRLAGTSVFAAAIIGWFGAGRGATLAAPTVKLESGVVEGMQFGASPNKAAFLGVPFAAPPVGALRWKPPQPPRAWRGVRRATEYGASCPQLPQGWLPTLPWNEDCLYLNVWTARLSTGARQPVILYFHGGGNNSGRSQQDPLGPAMSHQGVVFVSSNYRLGPFGFLAHPALTAESEHHSSGDYGLLDQIQALEWVRRNISRFGGDPDRITLMGQSSGALDVCMLMASPLAAGKFQAAIMQSGECQSTLDIDIRRALPYNGINGDGESSGERLARDLGVADGPDALRKLRAIPADKVLEAAKDPNLSLDAIVDGWVVPEQPAKIFADGHAAHVPVLVGSNANEATVFGDHDTRTVSRYREFLRKDSGKYAGEEFAAYPVTSDADVPARYLQFQTDSFGFAAWSLARAVSRTGGRAWLYYFSWPASGKQAKLGAFHGEELRFLSGVFPDDWTRSPENDRLAEVIRGYWTRFAKTGDPNGPGLPHWLPYDAHRAECFELGRHVGPRPIADAAQLKALDSIYGRIFADTGTHAPASDPR